MAFPDDTDMDNLQVSDTYDLILTGHDTYGNRRSDATGKEYILVELIAETGESYQRIKGDDDEAVQYIGEGRFKVPIRFETSGTHTLHVSIFDTPLNQSGMSLYGWAPASPEKTEIIGEGATSCKAGSLCRFVVAVMDTFGHRYLRATPDDIAVSAGTDDPTRLGSSAVTINQLSDGLFSVEYTGSGSGHMALAVAYDGTHVATSPRSVYMAMSNTTVGLLIGACIFLLSMAGLAFWLWKRHRRTQKLRGEWERMRRAIYKEYRVDAGAAHDDDDDVAAEKRRAKGAAVTNGAPTLLELVRQEDQDEDDWDDDADAGIMQSGSVGTLRGIPAGVGREAVSEEMAAMERWTTQSRQ